MNIDAFLFLQHSDLIHYRNSKMDMGCTPLIFIEPGMIDEAIKLGLDPSNFSYRPLPKNKHFQARTVTEANARASMLDNDLTSLREIIFKQDTLQGWDHGFYRLFFTRTAVAKHLGEAYANILKEKRIGLLRPNKPQLAYFDSFLSTDLFIGNASCWRIIDHYDEVLYWRPDHAAYTFSFDRIQEAASKGTIDAITHIPTSYQNGRRYITEIERHFKQNIDLPSALWDFPVRRSNDILKRIDQLNCREIPSNALRYREHARPIIESHFKRLNLPPASIAPQVELILDRCFMQAINYEGLKSALQGVRPQFVLTDHDAGHNGPLFSIAAHLNAPITILPHASRPTFAPPHANNVTAIEQEGYQTQICTIWGERINVKPVRLTPVASPVERKKVSTVCLLFNTLLSQGLSHIDFQGMIHFYHSLSDLCQKHGARLIPRLKPNKTLPITMASGIGLPAEILQSVKDLPLQQIAEVSDLCINYGEPTTAGLEFLSTGSYLINSGNLLISDNFTETPSYISDRTVPSYTDDDALVQIELLMQDQGLFSDLAKSQREKFRRNIPTQPSQNFWD